MAAAADAVVDADTSEPRRLICIVLERRPSTPGGEQRLLDDVLGLTPIVDNRQRQTVKTFGLWQDSRFEAGVVVAIGESRAGHG
jgi:hypothetical protein